MGGLSRRLGKMKNSSLSLNPSLDSLLPEEVDAHMAQGLQESDLWFNQKMSLFTQTLSPQLTCRGERR